MMLFRKTRSRRQKRKINKQNNYDPIRAQFKRDMSDYDDLMDKTSYASQIKTTTQHDRYTDDFSGMEP